MARGSFGGGATEYVENAGGTRLVGVPITMWSAETGGAQLLDLLVGTTPVTTVTSGTLGRIPVLSGPDGVVEMWADAGGGVRTRLEAYNGRADDGVVIVAGPGIDPTGVADSTAAILAKLTAAAGKTAYFPVGTYKVSDRLGVASRTAVKCDQNTVINQTTWGRAVFDLYDADDCLVDGFTLAYTGTAPRAPLGVSFRGDDIYGSAAGVYTNGNRNKIRGLTVRNMAMGVTLSNYSTAALNLSGFREGNVVEDIFASGIDHGVLLYSQDNPRVNRIRTSNHVDSSAGVNPNHLFYATSGTPSSRNIVASDLSCTGCPTGAAFQFKNTTGAVVSNLYAADCESLLNIVNVQDMLASNMVGLRLSPGGSGAIVLQSVGEARNRFADITLDLLTDQRAVALGGTDNSVERLTVYASHAAAGDAYDIAVTGLRNTVADVTIINKTAFGVRAVGLAGGSGHRVLGVVGKGTRNGVTLTGVTDCRVQVISGLIDVDPAIAGQLRVINAGGTTNKITETQDDSVSYPIIAQVNSAAALTLTAAYQEAVGSSLTVPVAGKLRITATFDITLASGADSVNGQLKVNGVNQPGDALVSGVSGRITLTRSWAVSLAAGTHTLAIGGSRFTGAGACSYNSGAQTGYNYEFVAGAL